MILKTLRNAIIPTEEKKALRATGGPVGPMQRRKLVVVGDGACGKTSLLMMYSHHTFPRDYIPTVFENFVADLVLDRRAVELALWDTAGQEDYDRLRPLSYPDTDVVLLCFAIDQTESLINIEERWNPEVEHFCQGVPKILVGLKADLRLTDHPGDRVLISPEVAQEVALRIGAHRYIECSAKTGDNVDAVFHTSLRTVWQVERQTRRQRRNQMLKSIASGCTIM